MSCGYGTVGFDCKTVYQVTGEGEPSAGIEPRVMLEEPEARLTVPSGGQRPQARCEGLGRVDARLPLEPLDPLRPGPHDRAVRVRLQPTAPGAEER